MKIEKRLPKGTAMGTIFAHAYANLTTVYHEIQVYFIRNTYDLVISKYLQEDCFRFSDVYEIFLDANLIKPRDLPAILNKVNRNFQLKIEKSTKSLLFLDNLINRTCGKYAWIYTDLPIQKMCALCNKSSLEVASETFHFVGLRESALMLKKKHKTKTFVEVN